MERHTDEASQHTVFGNFNFADHGHADWSLRHPVRTMGSSESRLLRSPNGSE